ATLPAEPRKAIARAVPGKRRGVETQSSGERRRNRIGLLAQRNARAVRTAELKHAGGFSGLAQRERAACERIEPSRGLPAKRHRRGGLHQRTRENRRAAIPLDKSCERVAETPHLRVDKRECL